MYNEFEYLNPFDEKKIMFMQFLSVYMNIIPNSQLLFLALIHDYILKKI